MKDPTIPQVPEDGKALIEGVDAVADGANDMEVGVAEHCEELALRRIAMSKEE